MRQSTNDGLVGYLFYFDYKRRNSPDFRKQLKKTAKKHAKQQEAAAEADKNELKNKVRKILQDSLKNDPIPESLQEREKFFVDEVARADELLTKPGDENEIHAALAFYRALRVYPSPVDLLNIYDKSLKPPVLEILRAMIVIEPPPAIANIMGEAASSAQAEAAANDIE
jgi:import receptor subunit TOM20